MYWLAHKTTILTSSQQTMGGGADYVPYHLIFRPSYGPTYEVYDLNSGHDQSMLLLRNEVQGLQSSAAPWEIRMFLKLAAQPCVGQAKLLKVS